MPLSAGDRLGPYEILSPLGAGGMGQVFRARDTSLDRDVAIKILPDAFATNSERMARFQREAKALAALNHPNIATIYGFLNNAMIMELVEGENLSPTVPMEAALQYARQIAEGLEAAHEKGIVHRDLKPANIRVTPADVVKLLDFGLASIGPVNSNGDQSMGNSPTLTLAATEPGVILGTAAYMAPEQAAGLQVDRRADIWSFGVILWELLSGKRLFAAESVSHTLADVLRAPIDFDAIPAATPPAIVALVRQCLERDLRKRLQWIGDGRIVLEEPFAAAPAAAAPKKTARGNWLWIGIACAAVLAAIGSWLRPSPVTEKPLLRFTESLGPDVAIRDATGGAGSATAPNVVISPDGSRLVFVNWKGTISTLYTRKLDQAEAVMIAGTEGASAPFFSSDGRWVAFVAGGSLKKTQIEAGVPVVLCPAKDIRGGSWGSDGFIYVSIANQSAIVRIPDKGGDPQPVTKVDHSKERSHRWPQILQDCKVLLFTAGIPSNFDSGEIVAMRLDTGERKTVQTGATYGRYLISGHLIFIKNRNLNAMPFNLKRLEATGQAVPIAQDVKFAKGTGGAQLAVSENGTFVYRSLTGTGEHAMAYRLDEGGKATPLMTKTGAYWHPVLSPDGKKMAVIAFNQPGTPIWILDLQQDTATRLTFDEGPHSLPRWSPDGKQLLYSYGGKGIFAANVKGGGTPELLLEGNFSPIGITPDAKRLLFSKTSGIAGDCQSASLEGGRVGKPEPCYAQPNGVDTVSLSPDGKWLVQAVSEGNISEIFVRTFPDRGGKWQVTTGGGSRPVWSPNGRELFYIRPDGTIMVLPYTQSGGVFQPGRARVWSPPTNALIPITGHIYEIFSVSPDGKWLATLIDEKRAPGADSQVVVMLNFFDEIRRRIAEATR